MYASEYRTLSVFLLDPDVSIYNRPFSLVGVDVGQEGGVAVSFAESAEGFVKYSAPVRRGARRKGATRSEMLSLSSGSC